MDKVSKIPKFDECLHWDHCDCESCLKECLDLQKKWAKKKGDLTHEAPAVTIRYR